jgi:hypothetical protein
MKLIFLDIDGVLNTMDHLTSLISKGETPSDKYGHLFDPVAVANLEEIIRRTGAKVVISSTWRMDGINVMRKMFADREINAEIVGVTPDLSDDERFSTRGDEIDVFLWKQDRTNKKVESYVIIDDDTDFLHHQIPFFVHTNEDIGITTEDVEKAVRILGELD